jgi:hypothetical protein
MSSNIIDSIDARLKFVYRDFVPGQPCLAIYKDGHVRRTVFQGYCLSGPIVDPETPYCNGETYGPFPSRVEPLEEPRNLDIGLIV